MDVSLASAPQNTVTSGKTRTTSDQAQFLTPNGSALSIVIDATPTPLVFDVNGTSVSVASDITISSLTAAPSSNNTCLVDDTEAADQFDTRLWGSYGHRKDITVDTMGSEITALVGKYAAFSHGSEYFVAFVESTTKLSRVQRGFFYNSSLSPVNPDVFSNNDTITLLKMGWIFVEDNGTTAEVTYTNPVWSFTSPTSPVTGDYWYDLTNNVWKRYDGASFQIIDRTLVGYLANSTTACIGARCVEFYKKNDFVNELFLDVSTTEIVKARHQNSRVNVHGQYLYFGYSLPTWNITTDLATSVDMINATEQASTIYYCYLTEDGDTVLSDIHPYYRQDFGGTWYHPHNSWRAVGAAFNNASSNITVAGSFNPKEKQEVVLNTHNGYGATGTKIFRLSVTVTNLGANLIYLDDANAGNSFTVKMPGKYFFWGTFEADAAVRPTLAFSLNATDLTANAENVPAANRLTFFSPPTNPVADVGGYALSWTGNLKIGDVVRFHGTAGTVSATAARTQVSCAWLGE